MNTTGRADVGSSGARRRRTASGVRARRTGASRTSAPRLQEQARSVHRDALRGRNRPGERAGRGVRTRRAGGATKSSKGRAASGPVAGQSGGSGPAHARRPDPGADADGCGVFAPTVHPGTGDTVLVGGWLMEQGRRLLARLRDPAAARLRRAAARWRPGPRGFRPTRRRTLWWPPCGVPPQRLGHGRPPKISCARTYAASGGRPAPISHAPAQAHPECASASVPSSPRARCVRGHLCGRHDSVGSASCSR